MPRRTSRRSRSDADGFGAVAVLAFIGAGTAYRWFNQLPQPWQIASAVLVGSLVLLLAWGLVTLVRRRREGRLLRAEMQSLSPDAFEERVRLLLADLGWSKLARRGGSGDRGVDLVGEYQGQRYIVQCKRYAKSVPPAHVRDLVGARVIQGADRALLVTTGAFTAQGYAEAKGQPVELWDGTMLAERAQAAAAQAQEPERLRSQRRRVLALLYAVLLVNSVALTYAFAAAGSPL